MDSQIPRNRHVRPRVYRLPALASQRLSAHKESLQISTEQSQKPNHLSGQLHMFLDNKLPPNAILIEYIPNL